MAAGPDGWDDGDESKAREYVTVADVVVWTPHRTAGRPLSLEPLPDLMAPHIVNLAEWRTQR